MPPKRVGIKPFQEFRENRSNRLETNILRWLIHALANFEHSRNRIFFNEILRLAAFTEVELRIVSHMMGGAVSRQLQIVNINFCAFVSLSRQEMLNFALSLNNKKANAFYNSFSDRASMPCGKFRFVDLLPKQRLTLFQQSHLLSFLARRLCFGKSRKKLSCTKLSCAKLSWKAERSILQRRESFDCISFVKLNPMANKVLGCILPLEFTDNGSLTLFRRCYDQTDNRCRSANHPFLPFRLKWHTENTVNVYFTANGCEILVLSIPFMQQIS